MTQSSPPTPGSPLAAARSAWGGLGQLARADAQLGGVLAPVLSLLALIGVASALTGETLATRVIASVVVLALLPTGIRQLRAAAANASAVQAITVVLTALSIGVTAMTVNGTAILAITTMWLVALAGLAQLPLQRLRSFTTTRAVQLPGFRDHPATRFPSAAADLVTTAALTLGVAATWFAGLWWFALPGALGALGLVGVESGLRLHQAWRAGAQRKRMVDCLAAQRPTFALYWAGNAATVYQIRMWLPILEQLGRPFFLIVRKPANLAEAIRATDCPVVLARTRTDLDALVVESLKSVMYVNNAAENAQMVRYPTLKHLMLNHGDSDKAPSYNPVSRMFDRNLVAGQAAIDRFRLHGVTVHDDQFEIVGRPQLAGLARATTPIRDVSEPAVLYAPTWYGLNADTRYSSLEWGPTLVAALLERGARVIFRPHPYAAQHPPYRQRIAQIQQLLAGDAAASGRRHLFGAAAETVAVTDCFNASDALVSDVSSIVNDYLACDKPVAMVVPNQAAVDSLENSPLIEAVYLIRVREQALVDPELVLTQLLQTDPLADSRRGVREHVLGDPGTAPYEELFNTVISRFI